MAAVNTEWILNLTEKVTAPLRDIVEKVKDVSKAAQDVGRNWELSEKKTKEALAKEQEVVRQTRKELSEKEKELRALERAWQNAAPGLEWGKAKKAVEDQRREVTKLQEKLYGTSENVRTLKEDMEDFARSKKSLMEVSVTVNQFSEVISKMTRSLDFAVDIRNLRTEFERLTSLTGNDLDRFLRKSTEIADVYKEDAKEVGMAANALTRQIGGSFESNLELIEEGLKRGANLHGDYLSLLSRYAPALKEMDVSAAEATSLIATAAQRGVDPANFLESIQKAGVEIRKMTKKTEADLLAIGVARSDLEGKTVMEAIQHIAAAMDGMTEQAKQMTISRIFKMQGERAGIEFVSGLSAGIPPLDEIPAVEEAATGFKRFFSNIRTWAGDTFGIAAEYSQAFAPAIQVVAGAIPIMTALQKVTWLNTIATGAWTVATQVLGKTIYGIPIIGWIAAIIAAIIAVVKYTEGWGKAWDHTFNGMKWLLKGFVYSVESNITTMVNTLMNAFDRIRIKWYEFKNAVGIGDSRENQAMIDQINEDVEERKRAIVEAQDKALDAYAQAGQEALAAAKSIKFSTGDDDEKEESGKFSVNDLLKSNTGLSFLDDDRDSKDGRQGDGLSVGGGRGGVKNINMTLNITNEFSVDRNMNVRDIADEITGMINDRLRDALVTI